MTRLAAILALAVLAAIYGYRYIRPLRDLQAHEDGWQPVRLWRP